MNILLVYPRYPDTFWSFKHALKFISKKAAYPPLGLLTVAAMLPEEWERRLIDMNVSTLKDKDIEWGDYVFVSAMIVQRDSVKEVIERCNRIGTKVVTGGPLFTTGHDEFASVDHFILGEAEITLPMFLEDVRNGCPQHFYITEEHPDITNTPVPQWDLINLKHYASMSIQYSRGCPYDCEFCDIPVMYGHVPRIKDTEQILRELDALYERGWRSPVFVVDDNFIGNKTKVKEMLPGVIRWNKEKGYPVSFLTEASLNLADDERLMQLMVEAGFDKVFVGLETPVMESLVECNKSRNLNRDMEAAVKEIQHHGMQVLGGFIVGFDSDPPSIFDNQIDFIQRIGVVTAMVGTLTALPKTKLYERLKGEGRLLKNTSGNNTDGSLNFVPKMNPVTLINGYQRIVQTIYSPKQHYERIITFLEEYKPMRKKQRIRFGEVRSFLKTVWYMGIVGKWKRYYWKLIAKALFKYRRSFREAVTLAGYGFHFRKVAQDLYKDSRSG